jgi:amino acid transporter
MPETSRVSWWERVKTTVFGPALRPDDHRIFHRLSLIAFFAWVGLGADGLSSTCYGPSEAFQALGSHPHLSLFVALATAFTIWVLSRSEAQVMELFPSGGGGYVVASKLLSPRLGMVAGSALLIDYVLTVAISIASGVDAIFSSLPPQYQSFKVATAVLGIGILTVMNLRGVKESVAPLIPVFMIFVLTHAFALIYAVVVHAGDLPALAASTAQDVRATHSELGLFGMFLLLLRAYGMGAGTYTGIEAVSCSMMILREPRVQTAKKTLAYMAVSLAVMATGLMIAYLLYDVALEPGKTLNAVLLERITAPWPPAAGHGFVVLTLLSETAILFIAAQAGFLSGPRVLASMAVDRWVPTRFASLSDRLVTHNGVMLMSAGAVATVILTGGSVKFLVVLYSINVFITFGLSQLGMAWHAWPRRQDAEWMRRFRTNAAALALTLFILLTMIVLKFHEGGWITLLVTGGVIGLVSGVRAYYRNTSECLRRLDSLVEAAKTSEVNEEGTPPPGPFDPRAKTAVVLVGGFNGLGLHTVFAIVRLFGKIYRNYLFLQVGQIDAGNFKGRDELGNLEAHVSNQLSYYVKYMRRRGYHADARALIGVDVLDEITRAAPDIMKQHPQAVFFGGQLAFPEEMTFARWFHNYLVYAVQSRLHMLGIPFIILPIRVQPRARTSPPGAPPPPGGVSTI